MRAKNSDIGHGPPGLSKYIHTSKTSKSPPMPDNSQKFRSVFPHEPLPVEARGYVHIQGAFLPKVTKSPACVDNDEHGGGAGDDPTNNENISIDNVRDMITKAFQVSDGCHMVVRGEDGNGLGLGDDSSSSKYLPDDSILYKLPSDCRDVLSVTLLIDKVPVGGKKKKGKKNENQADGNGNENTNAASTPIPTSTTISITKARIEYPSPSIARRVVGFIRKHEISPAQIFHVENYANISNDGNSCYTYSSKHIQATQVTQVPIPSSDIAWPKAGVPKFRRLLINNENIHDVEKVQLQRSNTRFVFMTNILEGNENDFKNLSIEPYVFQDALREAIQPFCIVDNNDEDKNPHLPAEIFLPSKKQSSPFKHCHIGTRSPSHAQSIIRELQGKQITLNIKVDGSNEYLKLTTGDLFLDFVDVTQRSLAKSKRVRGGDGGSNHDGGDIPGEPSRPECTSMTKSVIVPGLVCVEEFITADQESVLLAALTGPNAPWAPSQQNFSKTGSVKRRVQHYGYVFDYETANVLRDRDSDGIDAKCPPMPSLPMDYAGCCDEGLESFANDSVKNGDGWNVLAAVIEKVRRYQFQDEAMSNLDNQDEVDNSVVSEEGARENDGGIVATRTNPIIAASLSFPNINQITVNEYKRGQGIGSHIDTESAFDDGLISLSMGSDCVMEFRSNEGTKKLVHLPPRSLLLMSGPARFNWSHQIVTRMTDCVDNKVISRRTRVSLTLRTAISLADESGNTSPLHIVESSSFPPKWGGARNNAGDDTSDIATPETERSHVHAVYDAIATQWHHTRGKRGVLWPGATQFLKELPTGSIVADVGCGDGKYFPAIWEAGSYVIGTDISEPLLQTSIGACSDFESKLGPESRLISSVRSGLNARPAVAVADCMQIPMRTNSCDAAICIAVMHHLSTTPRRLQCLRELSRVVKPGGRINVQAWALKQDEASKRKFAGTDVFVPFNAQPRYLKKVQNSASERGKGDHLRERTTKCQGVAEMYSEAYDGAEYDERKGLVVFQRYCHMYREGELEDLVSQINTLEIEHSGFESGNHFVIMKVV